MARRVKKKQDSLTLFSFQDIMVCLTGVLILVSLLLALDGLTDQIADSAPTGPESQAAAAQAAAQEADLRKEVESLRTQYQARANGAAVSAQEVGVLESRERQMSQELDAARARAAVLDRDAQAAHAEMAALAARRAELERAIVDLSLRERRDRVQFRSGAQGARAPFFVEVAANGLRVGELDAQRTPLLVAELPGADSDRGLKAALGERGPASHYAVFVVHADGISRFETLRDTLFRNGYEVGWQLWDGQAGPFLQPLPAAGGTP